MHARARVDSNACATSVRSARDRARARRSLRLRTSATPRDDYDPETLFSPAVQRDFLPAHIGEMYGLEKRSSPFAKGGPLWDWGLGQTFIDNRDSVSLNPLRMGGTLDGASQEDTAFCDERAVRAGARETIYFDPKTTKAAIVTCGGLLSLIHI